MNARDARTLLGYNQWANQQLLSTVRALPPTHFAHELGASFGSVKGTLLHILDGEWHWLQYWQGKSRTIQPLAANFHDAEALADAFPSLEREQQAFGDTLTDELLQACWTIRGREYRLADLIQHAMNHSTYHRGQLAMLVRQLGHQPPATDFRVFLDQICAEESDSAHA